MFNSLSYFLQSNKQGTKAHKNVPAVRSGEMCKLCMTVTNLIIYTVKYANATIEAVEEAVKLICDAEPGPIKKVVSTRKTDFEHNSTSCF